MKFSIVALAAALTGFAAAQIDGLPTCAQPCVLQFTSGTQIGTCSNIDVKCICSSSTFLAGIACCLQSACSPADQITATNFAKSLCQTAGVTVPDSVSSLCPSGGVSSGSVSSTSSSTSATAAASSSTSSRTSTTSSSTSATSAGAVTGTTAPNAANIVGNGAGFAGIIAGLLALL